MTLPDQAQETRLRFDDRVEEFRKLMEHLQDKRIGLSTRYRMEGIVAAAFSEFFTQSPSFLSHQKRLEMRFWKRILLYPPRSDVATALR